MTIDESPRPQARCPPVLSTPFHIAVCSLSMRSRGFPATKLAMQINSMVRVPRRGIRRDFDKIATNVGAIARALPPWEGGAPSARGSSLAAPALCLATGIRLASGRPKRRPPRTGFHSAPASSRAANHFVRRRGKVHRRGGRAGRGPRARRCLRPLHHD